MRLVLAFSLTFVARRSTIRLPYVLPNSTIAPVVRVFRTSLVAVPALRRVEPVTTSGPTRGVIMRSAYGTRADSGTQARPIANAPTDRAKRRAPITYGVRPLVAIPTTTSAADTPSRR